MLEPFHASRPRARSLRSRTVAGKSDTFSGNLRSEIPCMDA